MLQTATNIAVLLLCYASIWFTIGLLRKRNDVADIAWGLGFILICVYCWATRPYSPLSVLVYTLVTLWGLRLALHIARRSRGKAEDFRYRQWREAWGKWFVLRSFLQVYVLQGGFMLVMSAPILLAAEAAANPVPALSMAGVLVWAIGFFFEAVGDYQLSVFVKHKSNKGDIMQTGLWRYTRHPNYFGDACAWWGLYLIAADTGLVGALSIVGPVLITFLLTKWSGVPTVEGRMRRKRPDYEAYVARTSGFIPMPPKKVVG